MMSYILGPRPLTDFLHHVFFTSLSFYTTELCYMHKSLNISIACKVLLRKLNPN